MIAPTWLVMVFPFSYDTGILCQRTESHGLFHQLKLPVFRCVHRLFDYRKTRRMRHMDGAVLLVEKMCDGSSHGGCEASCHTIWKSAWLRRVEPSEALQATAGLPQGLGAHVAGGAGQGMRLEFQGGHVPVLDGHDE